MKRAPICHHHRTPTTIRHYPATALTRQEKRNGMDRFEAQSFYEGADVTTLPETYRCTCGNQYFRGR